MWPCSSLGRVHITPKYFCYSTSLTWPRIADPAMDLAMDLSRCPDPEVAAAASSWLQWDRREETR